MGKRTLVYIAFGVLLAGLGGCVRSEMFVMVRDAERKVAEAQQLGADKAAPYDFEASKRWLDLARHEADEFDMAGMDFAKKSIEHADKAIQAAKGGGK